MGKQSPVGGERGTYMGLFCIWFGTRRGAQGLGRGSLECGIARPNLGPGWTSVSPNADVWRSFCVFGTSSRSACPMSSQVRSAGRKKASVVTAQGQVSHLRDDGDGLMLALARKSVNGDIAFHVMNDYHGIHERHYAASPRRTESGGPSPGHACGGSDGGSPDGEEHSGPGARAWCTALPNPGRPGCGRFGAARPRGASRGVANPLPLTRCSGSRTSCTQSSEL